MKWFHHPESDCVFVEADDFCPQECNEIGPAVTKTVLEIRNLLMTECSMDMFDANKLADAYGRSQQGEKQMAETFDLMIPDAAQLPSYVVDQEQARAINELALSGIGGGAVARIKLSGKSFALVDTGGTEVPVKAGDMVQASDGNLYMQVIFLRAKAEIQKAFFLQKYNPNDAEHAAPDCFSNDGMKPDPTAPAPQCENCMTCEKNAFGSGVDQNGNASAGKACSDAKIIAALVPNHGVHKLRVPPASFKNLGVYLKNLSTRGIRFDRVKTLIGFDLSSTFPVLTFQFGGFIPEQALGKLDELAQSQEAEDIANDKIVYIGKAAPKQPATTKAKPEPKKEPAEKTGLAAADDLGLGLEAEAKPEAKTPEIVDAPSDDDLMAELGL